ncbi:MAG: TylF/MycF family methyltransferase [Dehalococcoidia bacterium]|nr:TylF/MycF family methyltransferase [Dehalococcoidia bacterium]
MEPCRLAVEEYREGLGIDAEMRVIDPWSIYWRKGKSASPGGPQEETDR